MSSRKNTLKKFQNITNGDLSADITSKVTNIQYLDNICVQLNAVTSDATGTFSVEVSADYEQDDLGNVVNAGNWTAIELPSVPTLAGVDTTIFIDLNQLSAPWVRVAYKNGGGGQSGTVQGFISGKML
jgi:hypothetical protein